MIASGTAIIFGGIVLSRLFGFFYRFILARYLGPAHYGLFSLGIMAAGILSIFALFGLHEGAKRFIVFYHEKNRPDKVKGTVTISLVTVVSLSAIICFPVYLFSKEISIVIFSKPELESILKIFSMAVVFNSMLILLQEIFVGFEMPKLRALTEGFGLRFCPLVCAIFVILSKGDIIDLSTSYLIGLFIASFIGYFILYKSFFYRSDGKIEFGSKELYCYSFPLLFSGIVNLIYQWTDVFFIGIYLPSASVGIYSAVFTIADTLPSVNIAVSALFLTRAVRNYVKKDMKCLENDFYATQKKIFLFTLPVAIVFIAVPDHLIHIAFGEEFGEGSTALRILSIGIFAGMSFCPGQTVLLAIGKTKLLFFIHAAVGMVNLILNIILIQKFGIEGAAFATAFCVFLKHASIYGIIRRYFKKEPI